MTRWTTERDPTFGCEIWTGETDRDGYGFVWRGSSRVGAHRIAWERQHGPVPEGHVLDHLCRRRRCVEPSHLEPVKQDVNLHRRRWGVRVRRKMCGKGHDLTVHAMVTPEGGRLCRMCMRESAGLDNRDR